MKHNSATYATPHLSYVLDTADAPTHSPDGVEYTIEGRIRGLGAKREELEKALVAITQVDDRQASRIATATLKGN